MPTITIKGANGTIFSLTCENDASITVSADGIVTTAFATPAHTAEDSKSNCDCGRECECGCKSITLAEEEDAYAESEAKVEAHDADAGKVEEVDEAA